MLDNILPIDTLLLRLVIKIVQSLTKTELLQNDTLQNKYTGRAGNRKQYTCYFTKKFSEWLLSIYS